MNQTATALEIPPFEDPRARSDFKSEYYPRANGCSAPPIGTTERNERVMSAFLALYYDLNHQYAALLEARNRPDSPERTETETRHLQAIEKILIARDRLEDHCAPFGIVVEPHVENGFVVDIACDFGNVDSRGRPRAEFLTVTTFVPIPLPADTQLQDWPITIEGPGLRLKSPP